MGIMSRRVFSTLLAFAGLSLFWLSLNISKVYGGAGGALEAYVKFCQEHPEEKKIAIERNCIKKIPYGVQEKDLERFCQLIGYAPVIPSRAPTATLSPSSPTPVISPSPSPSATVSEQATIPSLTPAPKPNFVNSFVNFLKNLFKNSFGKFFK